jgi:hypothetical protein
MRRPSTIARVAGVAAIAAAGLVVPITAAGATTYPGGGNPPEVSPNSNVPTVVAAKQAARSTLPFTGTDIVELTAIAGVSAGVGLVMVRRSRRASTA